MVNPPSANDQTSSPLNSLSQLDKTQPCLPVTALCFFCYSTTLKSCNIWKFFSWKYLYTEMKWALSAFLPFLIDGLELCEKVTLLTPRYICSPVPGWLTQPGTGLYRWPRASLPQKAATGHWTSLPACPRALVHPMAKPEAPGGGVILCLPAPRALPPTAEMCDTCLQALCHGRGRYVACQAGWMLPLKWLFLLSFDVQSSLNCIFNWHKQADIFSIRNA